MDSLPEELYGEIMQYLSITDVFSNYCLINHNFLSTTKSLYNLSRYLCNVYHLSAYYQATREQLIQYFNWAMHTKSMQNLEFTGFATSGGVDDDRSLWWVDSLFHENGPGYCARDNKLNINVAGVSSDCLNLNEIKSIKREASNLLRSNQIIRKIFPNEILAEGDEPSYYEELIFKQIWRQAGYMFTEGNGIPQDERDEAIKKYQNIYKALVDNEPKLEIFRRKENDPYVLIEPLNHQLINAKNSFSCLRSIEFSRKGNFTCPVETFLVFISDNFIDIEAEELSLYDNLFSINDVHNLQENDSKIPKDYSLIESEGCLSIVFKWCNLNLKPILWAKFLEKECDNLSVSLNEIFSGKYVYVKLVNPDSRMREMNDIHPFPNIDAGYLKLTGNQITFDV